MNLIQQYTKTEFEKLFSMLDTATVDDLWHVFAKRIPIDDFEYYITRTEILYQRQYKALLRDESVEYDAMVTDYIEHIDHNENTTTAKDSGTDSKKSEYNTTNKTAYDTTQATEKSGKEYMHYGKVDTTTQTGSESTTRTGSETLEKAGTETHSQSLTDTLTKTGSENRDTGSTNTDTHEGPDTKITTGGYHDDHDTATVEKTNPMSISYSGTALNTENGTAFPNLSSNWDTADRQTATHDGTHRIYDTNGLQEDQTYGKRTIEDSGHDNLTFSERKDTTEHTGDTDKLTYTDRSDTTTYNNLRDLTEYNDRIDTVETSGADYKEYGQGDLDHPLDETKHTGTDTLTHTGTDTDTTTYGKTTETNATSKTNSYETGRHGYSPAELLDKSRTYILGTDAFRWLVSKFDRCFEWEVEL